MFYKYICKIYILADIERNCRKLRFIQEEIKFFYLEDFIFYKCKKKCDLVTDRQIYLLTDKVIHRIKILKN